MQSSSRQYSEPVAQYDSTTEIEEETEEEIEEETDITSADNTLTKQSTLIPTTQGNLATIAPENINSRGVNRIKLNINNMF
eukprot:5818896-Ditylum_brightwellii.AAC.1